MKAMVYDKVMINTGIDDNTASANSVYSSKKVEDNCMNKKIFETFDEGTSFSSDDSIIINHGNKVYKGTLADILSAITLSSDNATSKLPVNGIALDKKQDKLTAGSNIKIENGEISCDVSTMNFKGSVASQSDLPTENLDIGDVWQTEDTQDSYCWNGTKWVGIGTSVDLSGYVSSNQTNPKLWKGTKAEYDAITSKDDTTTYVITDEDTFDDISDYSAIINITRAEYDAMTEEEKMADRIYNIIDEDADFALVTNTVESGNMNAVTSNAVSDALTEYVKVVKGNFSVVTTNGSVKITQSSITEGSIPNGSSSKHILFSVTGNSDTNAYWINFHYDGGNLYCASNVAQSIGVRWIQFL